VLNQELQAGQVVGKDRNQNPQSGFEQLRVVVALVILVWDEELSEQNFKCRQQLGFLDAEHCLLPVAYENFNCLQQPDTLLRTEKRRKLLQVEVVHLLLQQVRHCKHSLTIRPRFFVSLKQSRRVRNFDRTEGVQRLGQAFVG